MMDDLAKFGYNWDVEVKNYKHTIYYIFLATIWYRNLQKRNVNFFFKIPLLKTPKITSFWHFQFSISLFGEIQSVKAGQAGPWLAVSTHVAEIVKLWLVGWRVGEVKWWQKDVYSHWVTKGYHYFSTHMERPPTHGSCMELMRGGPSQKID